MSMTPSTPDVDSTDVFNRLRALKADWGPRINKNELAIVLICACIDEGLDTRPRIVGALRRLDLDYRHVAITLEQGTGANPTLYRWHRDAEGRYGLHDDPLGLQSQA